MVYDGEDWLMNGGWVIMNNGQQEYGGVNKRWYPQTAQKLSAEPPIASGPDEVSLQSTHGYSKEHKP